MTAYISFRSTFHGLNETNTGDRDAATQPLPVQLCTGTETVQTAATDARSVAKAIASARGITPGHVCIVHGVTHRSRHGADDVGAKPFVLLRDTAIDQIELCSQGQVTHTTDYGACNIKVPAESQQRVYMEHCIQSASRSPPFKFAYSSIDPATGVVDYHIVAMTQACMAMLKTEADDAFEKMGQGQPERYCIRVDSRSDSDLASSIVIETDPPTERPERWLDADVSDSTSKKFIKVTEKLTPLMLKYQFVLEAAVEILILGTKIKQAMEQMESSEMLRPLFELQVSLHRQKAAEILRRTRNLFAEPLQHKLAEFIELKEDGNVHGTSDAFNALLFEEMLPGEDEEDEVQKLKGEFEQLVRLIANAQQARILREHADTRTKTIEVKAQIDNGLDFEQSDVHLYWSAAKQSTTTYNMESDGHPLIVDSKGVYAVKADDRQTVHVGKEGVLLLVDATDIDVLNGEQNVLRVEDSSGKTLLLSHHGLATIKSCASQSWKAACEKAPAFVNVFVGDEGDAGNTQVKITNYATSEMGFSGPFCVDVR
jgi:hypothetical protein